MSRTSRPDVTLEAAEGRLEIDDREPESPKPIAPKQPTRWGRMRKVTANAMPLVRSWAAYGTLPLAGLVTAPIIARALGPAGRGQLAGILQPMTLAGALAALGVPSAVTYFIGRGYRENQVISNAMKVAAFMTAAVAAILLLYSGKVSSQIGISRSVILLVWCAFLPNAFISIRRARLQGKRLYHGIDLERTCNAIFRIGFIAALYLGRVSSVAIYTAIYMAASLSASGALFLKSKAAPGPGEQAYDLKRGELLRYALFSSFGTIAVAMNSRLDQAIMPVVVPAIELGYYSVAVTVSEVPLIINQVAARNILAETSARMPRAHILGRFLIGGIGQLLLCALILATMPYLLPLVFGPSFAPAISLVKVLLLSTLIAYGADCASAHLAGTGHPGSASLGPAMGAASTVTLFAVFWHRMSALTAAWISVATQTATLGTGLLLIVLFAMRSRQTEFANV